MMLAAQHFYQKEVSIGESYAFCDRSQEFEAQIFENQTESQETIQMPHLQTVIPVWNEPRLPY